MEQTLVLIKPDAVGAHHIGDITKAYEDAGLEIRAMKMMQMTDRIARIHYAEHLAKPFYGELSVKRLFQDALHSGCAQCGPSSASSSSRGSQAPPPRTPS